MFIKKYWKNLATAAVLSVFLIYLFINVGRETALLGKMLDGYPAMARPAFWPQFMIVGLLITSLLHIYFQAIKKNRPEQKEIEKKESIKVFNSKVVGSIVIVSLYTYLSQYLGFTFSTFLFIFIYMWYLGERKIKRFIYFPILSLLILLFFFWRVMYLSLPKGVGIFSSFSNFIMSIIRYGA